MAQTQRGRESERETVVSGGKREEEEGGYFSVPDLGQSDLSRDAMSGSGSHKPGCEQKERE